MKHESGNDDKKTPKGLARAATPETQCLLPGSAISPLFPSFPTYARLLNHSSTPAGHTDSSPSLSSELHQPLPESLYPASLGPPRPAGVVRRPRSETGGRFHFVKFFGVWGLLQEARNECIERLVIVLGVTGSEDGQRSKGRMEAKTVFSRRVGGVWRCRTRRI